MQLGLRLCVALAAVVFTYSMFRGLGDRLIYYPIRYPQGAWDLQATVAAQDRWIEAAHGTKLNAWWFPNGEAHFATLFLHGNAGNVTHRVDRARAILDAGSAFLVVDYSGYGKSIARRANGVYMKMEMLRTATSSDSATHPIELSC